MVDVRVGAGREAGSVNESKRTFHQDLDAIRADIVRLAAMVTELIPRATEVLLNRDLTGAQAIIEDDDELDLLSLEIEERAYQVLTLQQPVASDLRALVTALRLVSEIERSGDLMVNVATAAAYLSIVLTGALLAILRPGNVIGWVLLVSGFGFTAWIFAGVYALLAVELDWPLPGYRILDWLYPVFSLLGPLLIVRVYGEQLNHYRFSLSCDGRARVTRIVDGQALIIRDWENFMQLPTTYPNNFRLGIWVRGKEMRFFYNDTQLFAMDNAVVVGGSLGMFARASEADSISVNFSDLSVYQLTSIEE